MGEKIILIRGPICAGKSTIIKLLLFQLKNCSLIDQDAFKRGIDPLESSEWRNKLAFETSLFLADRLMKLKRIIIADIHSSRGNQYEEYKKLASKNNYLLFSYLLYPPLKICLKRNKNREIPDVKYKISDEKIKRYWKILYKIPNEKCFDTSKKTPEKIVAEIKKNLTKKTK